MARGHSTLSRRPAIAAVAAIAAPFVLFVWMQLFHWLQQSSGAALTVVPCIGYRCLGYTLGIAALPLAGFLLLRRGIEPRHPSALGAGAGAACASWAGALINLW